MMATGIRGRAWRDDDNDTSTIEHAQGNGFAWCLMIGGLCAMPFTGGLSLIATLIGGCMLRTNPENKTNAAYTARNAIGVNGCAAMFLALVSFALLLGGIGLVMICAAAGGK